MLRFRPTRLHAGAAPFGQYPALMPFVVELFQRGEGPFAGSDKRIKFQYIAKD